VDPDLGGVLERVRVDVDRCVCAGAFGELLAQRGRMVEQARSGEKTPLGGAQPRVCASACPRSASGISTPTPTGSRSTSTTTTATGCGRTTAPSETAGTTPRRCLSRGRQCRQLRWLDRRCGRVAANQTTRSARFYSDLVRAEARETVPFNEPKSAANQSLGQTTWPSQFPRRSTQMIAASWVLLASPSLLSPVTHRSQPAQRLVLARCTTGASCAGRRAVQHPPNDVVVVDWRGPPIPFQ
jgi:hypothetical protein